MKNTKNITKKFFNMKTCFSNFYKKNIQNVFLHLWFKVASKRYRFFVNEIVINNLSLLLISVTQISN